MRGWMAGPLMAAALAAGVVAATTMRPAGTEAAGGGIHEATAVLQNADGRAVGEATLREGPNGVLMRLELTDLEPGTYAFHVHETGRCDRPDFESAGGHFAPSGNEHGFLNERGPHAGDLPNLHVAEGGALSADLFLYGVTLGSGTSSLFGDDGSALVLHEGEDDYRTDPAGDAGGRVACGVVVTRRDS